MSVVARQLLAGLGLTVAAGCASNADLSPLIAQRHAQLARVQAAGAKRCAPRHLAMAESHLDFARLEVRQGFPDQARVHLWTARRHTLAAQLITQSPPCSDTVSNPAGASQPPASANADD